MTLSTRHPRWLPTCPSSLVTDSAIGLVSLSAHAFSLLVTPAGTLIGPSGVRCLFLIQSERRATLFQYGGQGLYCQVGHGDPQHHGPLELPSIRLSISVLKPDFSFNLVTRIWFLWTFLGSEQGFD